MEADDQFDGYVKRVEEAKAAVDTTVADKEGKNKEAAAYNDGLLDKLKAAIKLANAAGKDKEVAEGEKTWKTLLTANLQLAIKDKLSEFGGPPETNEPPEVKIYELVPRIGEFDKLIEDFTDASDPKKKKTKQDIQKLKDRLAKIEVASKDERTPEEREKDRQDKEAALAAPTTAEEKLKDIMPKLVDFGGLDTGEPPEEKIIELVPRIDEFEKLIKEYTEAVNPEKKKEEITKLNDRLEKMRVVRDDEKSATERERAANPHSA